MKRHVTTLAITVRAESIEHRDFLARTIAEEINGEKFRATFAGRVTAQVIRAEVKRSRPVRRAK
jgi:hypothetical protein